MKKLLTALLCALPYPSFSDQPPWFKTEDVLEIRQGNPWLEIYYSNSANQNSSVVEEKLFELDGVKVHVWIELGGKNGGLEKITVRPLDEQVIAEPSSAYVKDGEDIVIKIIQPLF